MKTFIKIALGFLALVCLILGDFVNFILLSSLATLSGVNPGNALACTITPITTATCPQSRAGIATGWFADCADVSTLTFDANRQITAIVMVVAKVFYKIEFEKNTAFFNQEKTRNKTSINVAQTMSFIEPGLSNTVRNALEDINGCCCLHGIVKDNSGNYHYAGISYDSVADEWESEDFRSGEGSSNTGADPTADSAEYVETMTCNAKWYAPFWTLLEAGIPV